MALFVEIVLQCFVVVLLTSTNVNSGNRSDDDYRNNATKLATKFIGANLQNDND